MKKFILAAAILASTVLASCTKENIQPTYKAVTLADKGTLSQADFSNGSDGVNDKGTLSQADANLLSGDKGTLSQADAAVATPTTKTKKNK